MTEFQKTDKKFYDSVHHWLNKIFGKANKCENKNCNKKSKTFHWALKKGYKYEKKKVNFKQLCRSCHSKYDLTEEGRKKISLSHKGKPLKIRNPVKCQDCEDIIEKPKGRQQFCKKCKFKRDTLKRKEWGIKHIDLIRKSKRKYALKNKDFLKIYHKKMYEKLKSEGVIVKGIYFKRFR